MFFPFNDDNPTRNPAVVTYALVAVNVLAFVWYSGLPELAQQEIAYRRGFVPARIAQLRHGKDIPVRIPVVVENALGQRRLAEGEIRLEANRPAILLSLLTCMFLHGGWMHLIGNMWFLWIFGNNVEDRLGPLPFVGFYLFGGLAASLAHWGVDSDSLVPVIGASGAVAAILGAYAITWPAARVRTLVFLVIFITIVDLPALLVLGVWFLGQVWEAQRQRAAGAVGGVAWWAHIGGFLTGLLLMPLLGGEDESADRRRLDEDGDHVFRGDD